PRRVDREDAAAVVRFQRPCGGSAKLLLPDCFDGSLHQPTLDAAFSGASRGHRATKSLLAVFDFDSGAVFATVFWRSFSASRPAWWAFRGVSHYEFPAGDRIAGLYQRARHDAAR